jgi:hypothetical protein
VVVHEVRGNPEQVVLPVLVVIEPGGGLEEPVIGFLQEIVRKPVVARHAGEIQPDGPRRPIVEETERLLVHLEGLLRLGEGSEPLHVREDDVTHDRPSVR